MSPQAVAVIALLGLFNLIELVAILCLSVALTERESTP